MFGFRSKKTNPVQASPATETNADSSTEKASLFSKFKQGLSKTRAQFTEGLASVFLGKKEIDAELLEDIETQLLLADVGVDTTKAIIEKLTQSVARKELADVEALAKALQQHLVDILKPVTSPLEIDASQSPYVILMIGINGAGKTTTIGKLAKRLQSEGKSVMLAAGDTFRAAAIEQLKAWGERNNIDVVAQQQGSDSASVVFDALQSAKAKGVDVLIADTAGRLHTQDHLLSELKKVKRVMAKLDKHAPHETMLVLDAGTGQNALSQAKTFNEQIEIDSLTLTKLDGTAKGGIVLALANLMERPIRFVGVGEGIDDLKPFAAEPFIEALLSRD